MFVGGRGQITLFVLLGLMVLLVVGLLLILRPTIKYEEHLLESAHIDLTAPSPIFCGDKIVDSRAGEECDSGFRDIFSLKQALQGSAPMPHSCWMFYNDSAAAAKWARENRNSFDYQRDQDLFVPHFKCKRNVCGDGILGPGEDCDDGNTANGDACPSTCTLELCGNQRIDSGEECDSGFRDIFSLKQALQGSAPMPHSCWMFYNDSAAAAKWARENRNSFDYQRDQDLFVPHFKCKRNVCGDGILGPGEDCDDGNQDNTDGCTSNCCKDDDDVCCSNPAGAMVRSQQSDVIILPPQKGKSCFEACRELTDRSGRPLECIGVGKSNAMDCNVVIDHSTTACPPQSNPTQMWCCNWAENVKKGSCYLTSHPCSSAFCVDPDLLPRITNVYVGSAYCYCGVGS